MSAVVTPHRQCSELSQQYKNVLAMILTMEDIVAFRLLHAVFTLPAVGLLLSQGQFFRSFLFILSLNECYVDLSNYKKAVLSQR